MLPLTAYQGEKVTLSDDDIERGEKMGAFIGTAPDDDVARGFSLEGNSFQEMEARLGLLENGQDPSDEQVEALAALNHQHVIRLVGDDPDLARRVAEAEENKQEGVRPELLRALDGIQERA
jgi:hypothetical protein